ncbi:hypothetical protein ABPG77_006692 [Micractinium sp. CCAP 211/92]
MVLAWIAGSLLGTMGGVVLGINLLDRLQFTSKGKDYLHTIDYTADDDPNVPMPQTAGKPVSVFKKQLLRNTSPWLVQPDYDRITFINTILLSLWPHLSPAIHKMAMEQAKAPLEDVCKQAKILKTIRIDKLDLGTRPPRIDCFKSYQTDEDELIIETPAFWGGDMSLRVTAVVLAGSRTIDVPVDVANIQFKALTRITIKPLVETLPCFGGVTVSLLETPHFNMDLKICDSWDIMAFPTIPLIISTAIKVVAGQMLVFPNEYALPLMPNFGLPPPPIGMLNVKVVSATGLKGSLLDRMDPFVELFVRETRSVKTSTLTNNESPVWNECFDFVVDDPKQQALRVVVKDDDLVSASTEGEAVVPLDTAEFIRNPRTTVVLKLPLHAPGGHGKKAKNRAPVAASGAATGAPRAGGTAFHSVFQPRSHQLSQRQRVGRRAQPVCSCRRKKKSAEHGSEAGSELGSPRSSVAQDEPREGLEEVLEGVQEGLSDSPRIKLPAGALTGAELTLECTYFPFKSSIPGEAGAMGVEVAAPAPVGGEDASGGATAVPPSPAPALISSIRRSLLAAPSMSTNAKGVLTMTLKKAANLENEPDTYATISLYDPLRTPIPNIEYRTEVVLNEDSPRYNFKTDFVNISAASSLTITIYDNPGAMAALTSLKVPFLQKAKPKPLGKVRIVVADVATEGRISERYPLQEAQTGEVFVTMEWNPVDLSEEDAAAAAATSASAPTGAAAAAR